MQGRSGTDLGPREGCNAIMGDVQQPSFFEKTFANLADAWRDVAASAARSKGLAITE